MPPADAPGTPLMPPVEALNDNQAGLPEILNDNASPSASAALGVNEYVCPSVTDAAGDPEIVGGELTGTALTVIENGPRLAEASPSETLMTIFWCVPTSDGPATPLMLPVDALNDNHAGFPVMLNDRASPSGSEALGVNEYDCPSVTVPGGVPEIIGDELTATSLTVIENGPRLAEACPSETLMTMFE